MRPRSPKKIDYKQFERDQKALKEYMGSLPHGDFAIRKAQFCENIGVSERTLDSWIHGRSPIRKAYKIIINQIANKKVFNI